MKDEFETYCIVNGLRLDRKKTMMGRDMGRYDFAPTQLAWEIWQEAWEAAKRQGGAE